MTEPFKPSRDTHILSKICFILGQGGHLAKAMEVNIDAYFQAATDQVEASRSHIATPAKVFRLDKYRTNGGTGRQHPRRRPG